MNSKEELERLLTAVAQTHSLFKAGWERFRPKHSASETYALLSGPYQAREDAVRALFTPLWKIKPEFLRGEGDAIDMVLDFLEVDVAAFRAGYAKEWCYRKLKRMSLTEQQRTRIRNHALALFAKPEYRREWRELSRLLIVVADRDTAIALRQTADNGDSEFVKQRASLVLETLLQNRSDLPGTQQPSQHVRIRRVLSWNAPLVTRRRC